MDSMNQTIAESEKLTKQAIFTIEFNKINHETVICLYVVLNHAALRDDYESLKMLGELVERIIELQESEERDKLVDVLIEVLMFIEEYREKHGVILPPSFESTVDRALNLHEKLKENALEYD